MYNLYAYSLLLVIFVGLSIVLATSEIGWQLGVRADGRGGNNISALEQSLLGLLALMIGFTFLMALTRFEERREAVLNEANAIGTTALRARLLSEPHRTEILKLLREYAQIRVDYIPSGKSFAELPTIIGRSNAIHEALWQQAKAAAAQDNNMVPTGLFIQALNDMIDHQGKILAALSPQTARSLLRSLPDALDGGDRRPSELRRQLPASVFQGSRADRQDLQRRLVRRSAGGTADQARASGPICTPPNRSASSFHRR